MYLAVKKVKPLNNFTLLLTFESGEERSFDMKPFLDFGVFKELKDEIKFKTVRISFDTIEWDNEIDFDPELLYENSQPA